MTPEARTTQNNDRQLQQCGGGDVQADKVDTGSGKHYKHIVDLVSLVRHAIDPESPLRAVDERSTQWLSDQQQSDGEVTLSYAA